MDEGIVMQYIKYDLGNQKKNSVVEITLSAATNVMLMDKVNPTPEAPAKAKKGKK